MEEQVRQIAAILEQAERSYGGGMARSSRLPGWEQFYAWRLLGWPGLSGALGRAPGIRELSDGLARADAAYRTDGTGMPWAEFYARSLLAAGSV